jgi:DNA-binding CsgD family transcriptional regulator
VLAPTLLVVGATAAAAQAWAAIDRGDWSTARRLAQESLREGETPEALHAMARTLERDGDFTSAIAWYERAFRAFRAVGQTRVPALIAGRELSFLHAAVDGNHAVASGWMSRARRLAAAAGDCPETGWVVLAEAMLAADPDLERSRASEAGRLARCFGDPDLEFCALAYQGHALVRCGRVGEGMALVDEASAAASSGEVRDYLAVGEIYCKMLVCCELTLDVRRAEQWTSVARTFGAGSNAVWASAICSMHYGGVLTAAGRWSEAEHHLTLSAQAYQRSYSAFRSGAVVRLADLHVRQGRFREAAGLLSGHEGEPDAAAPLARLHLARGDAEAAVAVMRRHLRMTPRDVTAVMALSLLAEAEVAAGHLDAAVAAADEACVLAAPDDPPHLRGLAFYADGLVSLARADPGAAGRLESAVALLAGCGLPLEHARAEIALATALAATAPSVARVEAAAALRILDRLGARPDADRAARLLRQLGDRSRGAPRTDAVLTRREQQVLDLVAEGLDNARIAERLFISRRTVEHHVASILTKLGAASRAEAVALALRRG